MHRWLDQAVLGIPSPQPLCGSLVPFLPSLSSDSGKTGSLGPLGRLGYKGGQGLGLEHSAGYTGELNAL